MANCFFLLGKRGGEERIRRERVRVFFLLDPFDNDDDGLPTDLSLSFALSFLVENRFWSL